MRLVPIGSTVLILAAVATGSWAASSPNYILAKDALTSGGQRGTSTAFILPVGVLGASFGGFSSNSSYRLNGGYAKGAGIAPVISNLVPNKPTKPYAFETITLTATIRDPQMDPIECKFDVNGVTIQDWSPATTAPWTPALGHLGRTTLRVYARDDQLNESDRDATVYVIRHPSER